MRAIAGVPVVGRLAKRLAVDAGSSRVRIANAAPSSPIMSGLIDLPALVLVDKERNRVVGVGQEAAEVAATTLPGTLRAVHPIQRGVVAEPDLAQAMIAALWKVSKGAMRPSVVAGVAAGSNPAERLLLIGVLLGAGAARVHTLPRPLAAGLALGLPIGASRPRMIIDIGAGLVDVAVCALNQVIFARSFPFGGDWLDESIVRYIRRVRGEMLPREMAEQAKCELGALDNAANEKRSFSSIRLTHHTSYMDLSREEVRTALLEGLQRVSEELNAIWLSLDAKMREAVAADGATVVGGTAQLSGLTEHLSGSLEFPLHCAPESQIAIATISGLAQVAHNPARFTATLS